MKFKPYTNWTFEVIAVTRHPRNQDKLTRMACISPIFYLKFDRSLRLNFAGLIVDIGRDRSYQYVE